MPISFRILPEQRLVEAHYTGRVSIADIRDLTTRVLEDPLFRPDFRAIVDITGVEAIFKSGEVVQHQHWRKQKPPFAKIAVVASTDFEYGLARMFELASNSAGGTEMQSFRNMKDARDWLGLSDLQPK